MADFFLGTLDNFIHEISRRYLMHCYNVKFNLI